ncbi:MAG: BlaI/MecI/CopY family transcriptional regulator [Acidobacteriota bacterium]|nr:MAG: BlaI/MecI/CopY family transcriptional regulator [Acidobacteriota bacterium]
MSPPSIENLSRREREIMNALYSIGERASVEDVRQLLTDPPSYSAVRAMLVKLESKGYVLHHEEGLKYVYVPTIPRQKAQRNALDEIVRVFFGGSPGDTATALLKQEEWTDEELDELRAKIDAVRKERSEQ